MKKFSRTKKLLLTFIFAISCLLFNLPSLFTLNSEAYSYYKPSQDSNVTNGNFVDYSKRENGLPFALKTGWTEISGLDNNGTLHGVINTNFDEFKNDENDNFTLSSNPKTDTNIDNPDDFILMIKAKSNATKFGYTSSAVTLSPAKFYVLSVHCKTENGATGSIYTSLSNDLKYNFESITTNGQWKTFRLFVSTETFSKVSDMKIELRLGNKISDSKGEIFFDQVEIAEISQNDFVYAQNTVDYQTKAIDLNDASNKLECFENSNFENNMEGWTAEIDHSKNIAEASPLATINQIIKSFKNSTDNTNYASTFTSNNQNSLFIINREKGISSVKSNGNIEISQHNFYKLDILVKTGDISSNGLKITLSEDVEEGKTAVNPAVLENFTSSSKANASYNNFAVVSFFIQGNAKKDSNINIEFSLGTTDNKISGWTIIDELSLTRISQTQYEANKASGTEFNLSSNINESSDFSNQDFNFVSNSSATISYPASPLSWTASNENFGGVVRINASHFAEDVMPLGLTAINNPGPCLTYNPILSNIYNKNNTDENALVIKASNNTDSSFKSEKYVTMSSADAESTTSSKFSVSIKTINNSKAFFKVVDGNNNVIAEYKNITSKNDWACFNIYIKNGINSQTAYLVLGVQGEENDSYAFFDCVEYSSDQTYSNDITNSVYVDLSTNNFQTNNFSVFQAENGVEGFENEILNTSFYPEIGTRKEATDKYVLKIENPVPSYQILSSNYVYNLIKDNYYEISVWTKTDLEGYNEDKTDFGAIFEIVSLDKNNDIVLDNENKNKFANIVTIADEENNGWIKYSIYVLAENDLSVKILLGLGSSENFTGGKVYFDDLTVKEIEQEEYASMKANDTTIISKVIEIKKDTETTNPDENENPSNYINFWALSSSIILSIAIILAIAGYLIRRIPKKKMIKVEKSVYNKLPNSVDEEGIKEELKLARNAKLAELQKEQKDLTEKLNKLQSDYEEKSSKEQNETVKEKMYTNHMKTVNKLTREIDYVLSAISYLSDPANIKATEARMIKQRKKEAEAEFLKLSKEADEKQKQQEEQKLAEAKKEKKKNYKMKNN